MAEVKGSIERLGKQVPQLALFAVVIAVLMPAANYSFRLNDPTPAQLLVAVCIGVFSSVVCLWILDSVGIMRFRSEWVGRSVWAAAIVSILGTGVGVFQGAFADRKYPFEGPWMVRVFSASSKAFVAERQAVLTYSPASEQYWGYSETAISMPADSSKVVGLEIVAFDPSKPQIAVRLLSYDGTQTILEQALRVEGHGARFTTAGTEDPTITLTRPR